MTMLKSFTCKNFKCFEDETKIKLAPLTILCGTNSSGKSALIKGLLTLKQSFLNSEISNSLCLNGDFVSNGNFSDITYCRNNQPVEFAFTCEITKPGKVKEEYKSRADIQAFNNLRKFLGSRYKDSINKFAIAAHLKFSEEEKTNTSIKNTLSAYYINIKCYNDCNELEDDLSISFDKVHTDSSRIYNITLKNFPYNTYSGEPSKGALDKTFRGASCYFEALRITSIHMNKCKEDVSIEILVNSIVNLSNIIATTIKPIEYLTPLRVYPQRTYSINASNAGVGTGGENTPIVLREQDTKHYRQRYFKAPINNKFYNKKNVNLTLRECLNDWLQYLDMGTYDTDYALESLQININNYNLTNVGFGVSQVLPILISGLCLERYNSLILEQPEIHLHPKAQMSMADFLLSMAYYDKGCIVETHSDHIINRLTRRILEDKSGYTNSLVNIYFIKRERSIEQIEIDPIRGIVNAPEEFFTQFGSELMEIAQLGMKNQREGFKEWQS